MRSLAGYSRPLIVLTVLLALALHSLIPMGYMPDFEGAWVGYIPLKICDGLTHDDTGQSAHHAHGDHHHSGHHHSGSCPFGAGTIYSFDTADAALILPVIFKVMLGSVREAYFHEQRTEFSNASPRAPPFSF